MRSATFFLEIQFQTTFIWSSFVCEAYFWQRWVLNFVSNPYSRIINQLKAIQWRHTWWVAFRSSKPCCLITLTIEQKDNWKNKCLDLLDSIANKQDFFNSAITSDESWIIEYKPETKRQSRERQTATSPWPKTARMSKSKIKSVLICFYPTT